MCREPRFLLAAVNAKYIHSNPAVYSLRAYAQKQDPSLKIAIGEYTINNRAERILRDIYQQKPDFIGFSCYIWNISMVLELVLELPKILPDTEIWLGGPEASHRAEELLKERPALRGVMCGEGERSFSEIAMAYKNGTGYEPIAGIVFRKDDGALFRTKPGRLLSMDELPFFYRDMEDFENRIVYYESSRGCPFSCSYCLSSLDKTVRFRSLDLVRSELEFFLQKRVLQVKFVDRTFNCKKEHTMGIWRYLAEHDNGVTNFHFEVSADLFDEEELSLIETMRPGLIQLEIGVQTTNPETIREIRRRTDLGRLKASVARVQSFRNTHQHLDLIAGLPYEDFSSFLHSFDEVYRMRPDQLQLGFLKVLRGSYMWENAGSYGLQYQEAPPYEVISTKWLPYGDLLRLKGLEEMVEVYQNSGQFEASLGRLEQEFAAPSAMFLALAEYYEKKGLSDLSHSRLARYEIFYDFLSERFGNTKEGEKKLSEFRDALMFDLYLREKAKSRPKFALDPAPWKKQVKEFFMEEAKNPRWLFGYEGYDSRQMANMAHLEAMEDGSFVLFDYRNRDPLSHNGRALRLSFRDREEGEQREAWTRLPLKWQKEKTEGTDT